MKLDVVSVVVEFEEVSKLPRFLLAQLLLEGLVGLTGRVSAALFLLGRRGRTRDVTPRPLVGDKLSMTDRADKSARCEVSVRAAFGWTSLTFVRKLDRKSVV